MRACHLRLCILISDILLIVTVNSTNSLLFSLVGYNDFRRRRCNLETIHIIYQFFFILMLEVFYGFLCVFLSFILQTAFFSCTSCIIELGREKSIKSFNMCFYFDRYGVTKRKQNLGIRSPRRHSKSVSSLGMDRSAYLSGRELGFEWMGEWQLGVLPVPRYQPAYLPQPFPFPP